MESKIELALNKCTRDELDEILDELEIYSTENPEDESKNDKIWTLLALNNEKEILNALDKVKSKS